MQLFSKLRCRYRAKGFGVHSPFAYRFIREALCLPEPYLDYRLLGTDAQRLQYRLAAFLQPAGIAGLEGAEVAAALMACPQPPADRPPKWALLEQAPMAIADGRATAEQMLQAAEAGANVLATGLSAAAIKKLRESLKCGMTFASPGGSLVVISSQRLPRQDYDLLF